MAEPLVGSLRGYRWWGVARSGWLISPWFGERRWDPGQNAARCLARSVWRRHRWATRHPHGIPALDCTCGFYGLLRLSGNDGEHDGGPWHREPARSGEGGLVFGVVEAWGRIVLGTIGWRAQFVRPLALFVPSDSRFAGDGRIDRVARRYPIPIVANIRALASEWGPSDELPGSDSSTDIESSPARGKERA
jgi:hypothetical protein